MSPILSDRVITGCHQITLKIALQGTSSGVPRPCHNLLGYWRSTEYNKGKQALGNAHWRRWIHSLLHFRARSLSIWSRWVELLLLSIYRMSNRENTAKKNVWRRELNLLHHICQQRSHPRQRNLVSAEDTRCAAFLYWKFQLSGKKENNKSLSDREIIPGCGCR